MALGVSIVGPFWFVFHDQCRKAGDDVPWSRVPPFDPTRAGEHLHGHLGWLAAVALVHPAVLLRDHRRRAHGSVIGATALATLAGVIGAMLYPAYREILRRPLFVEAPGLGTLFERKEHLALGAIAFAWMGVVSYFGAFAVEGETRAALRRATHWAFVAAASFAWLAATFATVVASFKSF